MFENLTTVSQGNIGLAQAIATFTRLGYTVSVPLNDNQNYDLVVDIDDFLQRVQVKTTGVLENSGYYNVGLRRVRSNRTGSKIYNFDYKDYELLYVLTSSNDQYIIPTVDIDTKTSLVLNTKWGNYKVEGAAKVAKQV